MVTGKIWRISKYSYGYRVTGKSHRFLMTGYQSQGKASTFDQALLLVFAFSKGRPLTQHNRYQVKFKPIPKPANLYPHQEEAQRYMDEFKDRLIGIQDFSPHERVAHGYYEQGLMAGVVFKAMNDAVKRASERFGKTRVHDATYLEDPNTITVTDYAVTKWPANKPETTEEDSGLEIVVSEPRKPPY